MKTSPNDGNGDYIKTAIFIYIYIYILMVFIVDFINIIHTFLLT